MAYGGADQPASIWPDITEVNVAGKPPVATSLASTLYCSTKASALACVDEPLVEYAMRAIIEVHFPGIKPRLVAEALKLFYEIRDVPGMKKKPSTSELLDWLKLLMVEDIGPETLRERDPKKLIPPLHGALLKNEQDVHLFERLAFMSCGVRVCTSEWRITTLTASPAP